MTEARTLVKRTLSELLQTHCLSSTDSDIDEVVAAYIVGIIEDLGSSGSTDDLDLDSLMEMMEAYLPGFENIHREAVVHWMINLASNIRNANKFVGTRQDSKEIKAPEMIQFVTASGKSDPMKNHTKSKTDNLQKDKHPGSNFIAQDNKPDVQLLLELFPASCRVEVSHCLALAGGDTDVAAQLILHRQETGDSIKPHVDKPPVEKKKSTENEASDVKTLVLEKYSFVDMDEDRRTHRPAPLKQEPKKLVRYRDGQVVSLKGERFSEIKKPESEEMKKTFVCLKPSRKYHFH